jgi:hypothetical protein
MTTDIDIFLCHNSKDKPIVEKINQALKVKDRNLKTWIDKDNIPPGEAFQQAIQEAIPKTKSAAIFFGLHGVGKWQKKEIDALITQHVDRNIILIPILLPGVNQIPDEFIFLKELNWLQLKSEKIDNDFLNNLVRGIKGQQLLPPKPRIKFNWLIVILLSGFILYEFLSDDPPNTNPILEETSSNPIPTPEETSSNPTPTPEETPSNPTPTPEETPSNPIPTPEETPSNPTPTPEETPSNPTPTPEEPSRINYKLGSPYVIDVYGYNLVETYFDNIKEAVAQSAGYPIDTRRTSQIYTDSNRPTWLAYKSCVLYFDKSSEKFANYLAQELENFTGIEFIVQYVTPEVTEGVTSEETPWAISIHIIN